MAGSITASDVWAAISEGKRIALPLTAVNETLAGNLTIDKSYGNIIRLDPGGSARDVTLPAEYEGAIYLLINAANAAETITVKNAAAATVVTCEQNRAVLLFCSGGAWAGLAKFETVL